jgi:putative radical SAM domain protein
MSLVELIAVIKEAKTQFGIEGVTYSGGEPTCQENLPLLTKEIKLLGLGVISFTGRMYEEVSNILEGCDVVLDGSFKENLPETKRRLLGSKNQRIICLTERYKDCVEEWFYKKDYLLAEINIGKNIVINGDKI